MTSFPQNGVPAAGFNSSTATNDHYRSDVSKVDGTHAQVNAEAQYNSAVEVVVHLTTSKCMPDLLCGLEALPLNKRQLSS